MKRCHPLRGHPPSNHDIGRMMASLHPRNAPQGTSEHEYFCSGCYTAPQWWRFSCPWRCFHVRSWCATGGDALLLSTGTPSKQEKGGVPLSGGAFSCVIIPDEAWLNWFDMFSFQDMTFCFQSGFWRIHSHTVLIAASALTLFRRPQQSLSSTLQSSS